MTYDIGRTLADLERRLKAVEAQSRLKSASLDDTALVVRDSAGSLRGIVGQQGDGTTAVTIVNGPPPPQPSPPIAMSVLGGVTASWDGLFTDGVLPLDWSRTEVHASPDDGFTPTALTLQSTIETAQGATVVVPTDDPVYVRLVARTTSGTASTPSTQTGPYGPAPVVAGELLDGIVTTVKLADDAVTNAKVAVGAIGSTEITDNAVTTPKIVAGAVQTAQLDTDAVNASKIAAGAVTTAKLDALAVTADKIAANTITAAKLAAGSVDATALKADAITGKTITGGVINGAEFHSDDGAGGLVDIESGTVLTTASTGWQIAIDPSKPQPAVVWLDDNGIIAGEINGMGDSTRPGLVLSSGPFTDGAVTDWRWATRSGADGAINGWRTGRFRESDQNTILGGYVNLAPDKAQLAWVDTGNPSTNTVLQIDQGVFTFDEGRFVIEPPVSSNPAFYITTKTGHTGQLIRAQVNLVNQFVVTATGAVTAAGSVTAAGFTTTGAVSAATLTTTGNTTIDGTLSAADVTVSGQITKDASWSTLSKGTGWTGYGGNYGPGRYRRMPDGSVFLRDLINRTASTTLTSGEIIATLPVGYRPTIIVQQNIYVGGSTGGPAAINININGTITISNLSSGAITYLSTGNGYVSLNGFQFFTD